MQWHISPRVRLSHITWAKRPPRCRSQTFRPAVLPVCHTCARPLVEKYGYWWLIWPQCFFFSPPLCRSEPEALTPLNSHMYIRPFNEQFMHCDLFTTSLYVIVDKLFLPCDQHLRKSCSLIHEYHQMSAADHQFWPFFPLMSFPLIQTQMPR